jgi:hypothetical protein
MAPAGPAADRWPRLVGRDQERARVAAFVAALPEGARTLSITGEHGERTRIGPADHHGTTPCRSTNVPLGPEASICAIRTIASVPSATVCVPRWSLKSVPV